MAEVFVSPGVYTQEIDDTFVPAGAGTIGAALIGRTTSGPAFRPTQVNNFSEFTKSFGTLDVTKYMPYAAKSYLQNGSPLTVVRVMGRGTVQAGEIGALAFPEADATATSAIAVNNICLGFVRKRTNTTTDILLSGTYNNFAPCARIRGRSGHLPTF